MESRVVLIEYRADHLSFRCPGRCYPGYLRGDEGFHRGHVSLVVTEELKGQLMPQGFLYCACCSHPLERVVTFREGRSSFVTRHHGGQLLLTRPGPARAGPTLGSAPLQAEVTLVAAGCGSGRPSGQRWQRHGKSENTTVAASIFFF